VTTQLTLYNGALCILSQPELSAVDEDKEARHVLDHWYEDKDSRKACLEMGNWNFATRTLSIDYNSSITPSFGLKRAFSKPSDWVRTTEVSADEYFSAPMTDLEFKDEAQYFFADIDKIYVRMVSNDNSYGRDLSLWPESFTNMVEAYLAWKIAPRVNPKREDESKERFEDERKHARSKDALQEGIKFMPKTGWQRSRRSRTSGSRDLGSRSSLTG
jgi:hypothetical protein